MEKKFINWKKNFNTNVAEIDEQHQRLVALINELYESYVEKKHKDTVGKVIKELVDYTVYHFDTEEKYFKQFNYEHTEEHINEHKSFIDEVTKFNKNFGKNEGILTTEVLLFLQKWITSHILGSDMKYVECFADNGLVD